MLRTRLCSLPLIFALIAPAQAADKPWPDTFVARVEALALVQTLNATILGARSATFTLDAWCADHKLATDPKIRARRVAGLDRPFSAEGRKRLSIGPDEPVKYRHVELLCGDRILSEADNWYVPSRLTPEMNRILDTTDTPFGRVVADLQPTRQTMSVAVRWKPLPDGWELHPTPADNPSATLAIPAVVFEHRAILLRDDRTPFCEVEEHYTGHILDFGPP
jgi:hypothetical protein